MDVNWLSLVPSCCLLLSYCTGTCSSTSTIPVETVTDVFFDDMLVCASESRRAYKVYGMTATLYMQMDEKARLHLQLTLSGKERPVPSFFTKYITGTYGMDSFPPFVVTEDSKFFAGAELALIMGRTARRLSEEEAMDYVAGVAIGQDFAERDWVTNEMRWLYGKAYDAPIALGLRHISILTMQDSRI